MKNPRSIGLYKTGLVFASLLCICLGIHGSGTQSLASGLPDSEERALERFATSMIEKRSRSVGYPINQNTDLKEFYEWYLSSGLYKVAMNNVGNPHKSSPFSLNTHPFENRVVDFFAPFYGFEKEKAWGIVTSSGTDGNNHGIYFGVKSLSSRSKLKPILYVSQEAHYSIKKLGDLQGLEMRIIRTDSMGHMDVREFERVLNPKRPALIVLAIGTTFKGAADDQTAIDQVIRRKKPVAVYRHLDAALFGGYLPFSEFKNQIDRHKTHFDSIAVSGHKFFGFDDPTGFFITTEEILTKINPLKVPYLNDAVPTITCSRSALGPLKYWWKIQKTGSGGFSEQAKVILDNAQLLKRRLDEIHYPAWLNPFSNTVFFKRPPQKIIEKYDLAQDEDPRLGGPLAHLLVMQHVSREVLDQFVKDLKNL